MLGLSKSLINRVLVPATVQVHSVRHKTVDIITITPPIPYTNNTMGPYPRTKEERERAAKKYNLIPEDYETYDEDEGWGDYPKLPAIGAYNRDKYEDFDDPQSNRNYGEPYHRDHDLYTWERIDPLEHKKVPPLKPFWQKLAWFLGTAGFVPAFIFVFDYFRLNINHPYKMRQLTRWKGVDNPVLYRFPPSPNDDVHHHHH